MSQHATEACGEGNELWLPLTEYSVKSGVSLSTIRRKIKSNSIPFRLEKGRYLILFSPTNSASALRQMVDVPKVAPVPAKTENSFQRSMTAPETATKVKELKDNSDRWAVQMVRDTFEQLLKEKDERIRLLEQKNHSLDERLNELKLLVRVLEEKYEVRY